MALPVFASCCITTHTGRHLPQAGAAVCRQQGGICGAVGGARRYLDHTTQHAQPHWQEPEGSGVCGMRLNMCGLRISTQACVKGPKYGMTHKIVCKVYSHGVRTL